MPVSTPIIPPMLVSTAASVKNCARILFFLAPSAFFSPISLVLSVTDTSIMFITPIPPTSSEMLAIHISILLVDELRSCNDFACSNRLSLLYSTEALVSLLPPFTAETFSLRISADFLPAFVIESVSTAFTIQFSGSS